MAELLGRGLGATEIGQVGGGKHKTTGSIDVAMIQSVARHERPGELFEQYGLIVVDECHHLPAVTFEACVRDAPTRLWLGLTATPYRRDGLEGIMAFQCGPIRYEITSANAMDSVLLQRELIVHETSTTLLDEENPAIQAVFSALVEDRQRTEEIAADIHGALLAGRTCLVLTQRTDHIDRLVTQLATVGDHALVLRGGLGARARAAVADAIASRQDGDGIVLIATGSYLGEGFDWPELDTLFLAFPIAFKGRVVQYVGRLLRAHAGKHHVELHDYVDVRIPMLQRMHHKRLPAYRTLGFDVPRRRASPG